MKDWSVVTERYERQAEFDNSGGDGEQKNMKRTKERERRAQQNGSVYVCVWDASWQVCNLRANVWSVVLLCLTEADGDVTGSADDLLHWTHACSIFPPAIFHNQLVLVCMFIHTKKVYVVEELLNIVY